MYNVFVAYNTDSIMRNLLGQVSHRGFRKLYRYVSKNVSKSHKQNSIASSTLPWGSIDVPKEVTEIRKEIFFIILSFYQKRKSDFNLYFDILNPMDKENAFPNYVERNADIINNASAFIFVVDTIEISFWQLQEAYFASYYNKKVLCLKTEDFLRCISQRKLDKELKKLIKNNNNFSNN